MEWNNHEIWHIRQVMRARGISHCETCRDIEKKLSEALDGKVE